jgi:hypothetical protein
MNIQVVKKLFQKLKELKKQDRIFVDGKRFAPNCRHETTQIACMVLYGITEELPSQMMGDSNVCPEELDKYLLVVEEFLNVFYKKI